MRTKFKKPYAYHESVCSLEICQCCREPSFSGAAVSLDGCLLQISRWDRYRSLHTYDTLYHLLRISFQPGFLEQTHRRVFNSEDHPNVIALLCTFEFIWETLHIWGIHRAQGLLGFAQMTAACRVNNWIDEFLRITVKLKNTHEATNVITQILMFLAYGRSPFVMTVN